MVIAMLVQVQVDAGAAAEVGAAEAAAVTTRQPIKMTGKTAVSEATSYSWKQTWRWTGPLGESVEPIS